MHIGLLMRPTYVDGNDVIAALFSSGGSGIANQQCEGFAKTETALRVSKQGYAAKGNAIIGIGGWKYDPRETGKARDHALPLRASGRRTVRAQAQLGTGTLKGTR